MVYREVKYGFHKVQIRDLLRRRLVLKEKVRYHDRMVDMFRDKVSVVELEVTRLEAISKCSKNSLDKVYKDLSVEDYYDET